MVNNLVSNFDSDGYTYVLISLGYGFNYLNAVHSRLDGSFGGLEIIFTDYVSIMTDYDGDIWAGGGLAHWRDFTFSVAYVGDKTAAYRIGYALNLHNK